MNSRIIIPIINNFNLELHLPIILSNTISINTISSDDFFLIHQSLEETMTEFKQLVTSTQLCITIEMNNPTKEKLLNESSKIQFLLNYFKGDNPIYFLVALAINKTNSIVDQHFFELPATYLSLVKMEYTLRKGIDSQGIILMYETLNKAIKNKKLNFTIQKFNDIQYCSNESEKYVDTTITLESLIPYSGELSYRFRLLNTFLCMNDVEKRSETMNLFKSLYDVRSGIVHGDMSQKKRNANLKIIQEHYTEIYDFLRTNIFYYIVFLSDNKESEWANHLEGLILGYTERLI